MMNLKKRTSVLFIVIFALSSFTFGQNRKTRVIYDDYAPKGEYSVCAWDRVNLYRAPGQNSQVMATIHFSEEVMHLGREAFVRGGENNNYIWVEAEDGREGWIDDQYFVSGGGNVVLLQDKQIYEKPSTRNSISKRRFTAGELAILTEFANGWVKLTGKEKKKMGWVEGYDAISTQDYDIETASLISRALAEQRVEDRRNELRKIRDGRSFISPLMREVVDKKLNDTYRSNKSNYDDDDDDYLVDEGDYTPIGEDEFADRGNGNGGYIPGAGANGTGNISRGPSSTSAYMEKEVMDNDTGETYIRVFETGTIQPVKAKNPPSIYYAYHKFLPKGSTVLLAVPGTKRYVKLEIIAALKPSNKHMIGLGAEAIKAVFGETQAKNVSSATINYPKY